MRRFSWFYRNQISITAKAMQYSLFTVFVSANHRTEICIFVTFFAAFFSLFQLISDSNASLRSKTNWHYQLILFSLILITWLKSVLFFFQHFFVVRALQSRRSGYFPWNWWSRIRIHLCQIKWTAHKNSHTISVNLSAHFTKLPFKSVSGLALTL